jgi:general secretion pathway protein G
MKVRTRTLGFTLGELLVSVAIISLLASMAMPIVEMTVKRRKEAELRVALRDIRRAIDAYKDASDQHRIAVADDASGYPPTLFELSGGVTDLAHPGGAKLVFLRRIPRDPMNADESLGPADTWGVRSYASPAEAPRAGDDVFDVYSQSGATGMNGVPYAEW